MDVITHPDTNQLYLVLGGQSAAVRLTSLAAHLALRGPLLLLDCGNRANPLPLARELRRLTADPVPALRRISTARAFTCYQVAALFEQVSGCPAPQPVLVFDLLASFYDESVTYAEARRLLEQCLRGLAEMRRCAPVLVSARPPLADFPERAVFVELLRAIADRCWIEELPQPPRERQLSLLR